MPPAGFGRRSAAATPHLGASRRACTPRRPNLSRSDHVEPYITRGGARPGRGSARLFRPATGHGTRCGARARRHRHGDDTRTAGALPRARARRPGVPRPCEGRARSIAVPRAQAAIPALSHGRTGGRRRPRDHGATHRHRDGRPGPRSRPRHPARDVPPRSGAPPHLDWRRPRAGGDGGRRSRPAGGVRCAGQPAAARPRAAARDPGDRGRPGRDRFCDDTRGDHVPVVRLLATVATSIAPRTGPVPHQGPFRGRF